MDFDLDVAVIGAGAVGLAVAAEVAETGQQVGVLEKYTRWGMGTSSRNSEVIHAGIHYPPGSLKARLCVEGNRILYEMADAPFNLPVVHTGKITVAVDPEECTVIEALAQQGRYNGVPGLHLLDGRDISRLEPAVQGLCGILTESSGITSAHALMDIFAGRIRDAGGLIGLGEAVTAAEPAGEGYRLFVNHGSSSYTARTVVNAAGLFSDQVAGLFGCPYRLFWAKGDYCSVDGPVPVSRLIYPIPSRHSLGAHIGLRIGGGMRLGPDLQYVQRADRPYPDDAGPTLYSVAPEKAHLFREEAARYLPAIAGAIVRPESYGIRPKLQGPEDDFCDFAIVEESGRGLPRLINLVGIESPGLTAAPAIGRYVRSLISRIT